MSETEGKKPRKPSRASRPAVASGSTEAPVKTGWQAAFQLKTPLVQKDVYAFETQLRLFEKTAPSVDTLLERVFKILSQMGYTTMQNIEAEHHLKAAIRAGWVESPACEVAEVTGNGGRKSIRYLIEGVNVDELHPGKVRWYGARVSAAYHTAVEIPDPNS